MAGQKCTAGCTCGRHYERTASNRALISAANNGRVRTAEQCKRMSDARRAGAAIRNPGSSYTAIHKRLRRERGTPSLCESCGTTESRKFEWAYAGPSHGDGSFAYSTDLSMYVRLCTSCHVAFDKEGGDVNVSLQANICHQAGRENGAGYPADGGLRRAN